MIDISKAIKTVDRETGLLATEKVVIADAVGRVLGEDIIADTDLPPFDRSQMDGFAVVAADTRRAPVMLKIVGESAAGKGWHKTMKGGEAVRIMTGAPVPTGADAVQKVELTRERSVSRVSGAPLFRNRTINTGEMVEILEATEKDRFIVRQGSEIVEIRKKPGRDQIRNSNSIMLDVLSRKFGAETLIFPIVKDEISDLKYEISNAVKNIDILILTGGVSVGKYDHTKAALTELGAEIFFDKVRLKPGKPAVFARLGETLIFGLPGNPVSAAVTFHLFVRKAILKLQGAVKTDLQKGFAVLASDAKAARERDTYLPSRLETNNLGMLVAYPLKWQGSSDFIGFAQADSLIFVRKGEQKVKGEIAEIAYL